MTNPAESDQPIVRTDSPVSEAWYGSMLGHASAAITLDVYADLFDEDLDAVVEAMNRQLIEAD
jgi:hypothetical protein